MSPIEQEIIEEFEFFDNWMDKYEHIIALGKEMPVIEEEAKVDGNIIKGCQSQVWLTATKDETGQIHFSADADALIARGMIALILRPVQGQPAEVVANTTYDFLKDIGLEAHLSPTRANGLRAMIKQIRLYGIAFQAQ